MPECRIPILVNLLVDSAAVDRFIKLTHPHAAVCVSWNRERSCCGAVHVQGDGEEDASKII